MSMDAIILRALNAIDAPVTDEQTLASELAAALEASGYVIRKRPTPRKPEQVDAFNPSTGNAEVDAFMRRRHRADWRKHYDNAFKARRGMAPMPPKPRGVGVTGLTMQERAELYSQFNVIETNIAIEGSAR